MPIQIVNDMKKKLLTPRLGALSPGHFLMPLMAVIALCFLSSAQALAMGILVAFVIGNPFYTFVKSITHRLLACAIVGLGAGMDLLVVSRVGFQGLQYTVVGLLITFFLGIMIGRILKTPKDTSLLLTAGTAICGGSAIAAVAPVIGAKHQDVTIALGTVFVLNAVALVIFPIIGHAYLLSEPQFGLWSALAIHDTSSVLGASMQYGPEALKIGTTIKLARALWIVPMALLIGIIRTKSRDDTEKSKIKIPWFIVGFIATAAIVTFIPAIKPVGAIVEFSSKRLMVLTLFLIGSSLNKEALRAVGIRPFVQGVLLWLLMSILSFVAIISGLIVAPSIG